MNRNCTLIDRISGKILFQGTAQCTELESGGLIVTMPEYEETMLWKILKKGIIIENTAPSSRTVMRLYEKGSGQALIQSEYGELVFPVTGIEIRKTETETENRVFLTYRLEDGEDMFSFELMLEKAETEMILVEID